MIFLAQATATGMTFWQVAEHAALLVAIAGGLSALIVARRKRENVRVTNQPLEIDGEVRVVGKDKRFNGDACDQRHQMIADRLGKLEEEQGRIYQRIDDVNNRASENLTRAMDAIRETMRKLPAEVIHLLRDTGQLKNNRENT